VLRDFPGLSRPVKVQAGALGGSEQYLLYAENMADRSSSARSGSARSGEAGKIESSLVIFGQLLVRLGCLLRG
jgi:hypothetical protein